MQEPKDMREKKIKPEICREEKVTNNGWYLVDHDLSKFCLWGLICCHLSIGNSTTKPRATCCHVSEKEIRYIHNKTHKHTRERALVSDELINDHEDWLGDYLELLRKLLRIT